MPDAPVSELEVARAVLDVARELALELHPHRRRALRVSLDSSLDDDFGFDSLGRVELLVRLERRLHARLPESLLAAATTPRDLVAGALAERSAGAPRALQVRELSLGPAPAAPEDAETLCDVLEWHVREHPDRTHVVLEGEERDVELSYRELRDGAARLAAGLRARGIERGDSVAIMLPTSPDFFLAFFGTLWAGAVPVPIYPPFRPAQLEDHLRRQAGILTNADARALVVPEEARGVALLLGAQVRGLHVETAPRLLEAAGSERAKAPAVRAENTALLQYTSGSTGQPKGVVVSHANLLANVRAMGAVLEVTPRDVFVSWLPLYHDMGLIGAWLGSLYHSVPAVIAPPLRFLARPESWLWSIHGRRGTISAAPNFAYELCMRGIDETRLGGLDLSSWRVAVNGSEPVSPDTLRRFAERFAKYGFRREALMPVYGLAECSVGLSFPPAGRGPLLDRIARAALAKSGVARPAAPAEADALELPSCGRALPGHEIRIVDPAGQELGERRQGRVQFRGPSTTRGYFRNETLTRALFSGDWLESGDLGYLADGEIYITGRTKDMIIRAGRNIYPHELEEAVGNLEGIRKGCVAVFASADRLSRTDRLIVVAETRVDDSAERQRLQRRIEDISMRLLDTAPDEVVLSAPHTVLKTSSGKLRRSACRELYEAGRLGARPRALSLQIARLTLSGARERTRAALRRAGVLAWGAAWWGLLAAVGLIAWPLVVSLPRRSWRWAVLHGVSRGFLRATAAPFRVDGAELVPRTGGAVLVANHASYLDGLVLAAALRRPARFVVKRELERQWVAGPFLRRLGALFVERFEFDRGVADAERTLGAARAGDLLVFFPEGTLRRERGLQAFHLGAFAAACAAGVAVVPAAIRGTRGALRGDQWLPRRTPIEVRIGAPLTPRGTDWASELELRDRAYAWILAACGEEAVLG